MAKCHDEKSVLADVNNNEENVYLQHRHNCEKSWLGLNDISTEGDFTWADLGRANFTAWAKNQPNNFGEEDCVHALGVEFNYEWNDVKCSDCHQYTCKKGKMQMLEHENCITKTFFNERSRTQDPTHCIIEKPHKMQGTGEIL